MNSKVKYVLFIGFGAKFRCEWEYNKVSGDKIQHVSAAVVFVVIDL